MYYTINKKNLQCIFLFFEISNAFVINPYPINQNLLDTDDKINAFNDSNKFDCNVIGGDPVSELRDTSKYSENIDYIANIDFSNNPFKFFTPSEKSTDNEKTVDDDLLHTHSHEMHL